MFHKFHNLTLQRKQMLIIMLISTVALLLACVAFVTYDSFSYRRELVAKTASLAEVVGINTTAAIDFNDPTAAGQTLAALRAEPNIMVAHLYKTDGERFATYTRAGAPPQEELPLVSGNRQEFTKDYLWLVRPIIQGGETVGTIELIADLGEFRRRLWSYASIVAIVFGGALVVAFILSLQLGRIISRPVQHLAKVVQSVAHDKNYSVRATKQSEDELGQLIDGFNEMLGQIQQRDGALQTARDNLEFRVAERTKELDSSLSLLNATLDSTTDGILATKLSGVISCTNTQFRLMWGIRRELLERQPELIAFIAAQTTDPEQYQARVTAIFKQPELEAFDVILLKDGRTFERYVKPQRIEGQIVGLVINFRDVTARKQAEAELRWKSAFLEAQAASSIDGMLVVSDAGQKIFQNQRLVELWQIPTEIATDPDDTKQIQFVASRTRDPEKFVERITHLQAHPNEVSHDEIELMDGAILDRHTYPVVGPDGTRYGRIWAFRDITERKQAEAELAAQRDLLQTLLDNSPDHIYFKDPESRFLKSSRAQAAQFGMARAEDLVGKSDVDFFAPEHAAPARADELEIIRTGQPLIDKVERLIRKDGRVTWALTTKMPLRNNAGEIVGTFGISKDITAIKLSEAELRESKQFLQSTLDALSAHIAILDEHGTVIAVNAVWRQFADNNNFLGGEYGIGSNYLHLCESATGDCASEAPRVAAGIRAVLEKECEEFYQEYPCHSSQEERWFVVRATRFESAGPVRVVVAHENVTERKHAEAELHKAHKELVATSRQAGMAEVATGVLHNVGNVLNSVNVASTCIADNIRKSKAVNLAKVVGLLRDHEADLSQFLSADPKGKQIPGYLDQLAQHLALEQTNALKELSELQKHIDHIKDIVTMQQSFAKVSGLTESVNVIDLIEDALRMNESALARHDIKVIKEFAALPPVTVDKHKVLQILVNLVCNAKQACDAANRDDKRMTLRVLSAADHVQIAVADNGVGIPPENLTRIFNHGFTTKKNGHGFGLHSGALAAKEMGGALRVQSDGAGCGTVFTLELPLNPTKQNHA